MWWIPFLLLLLALAVTGLAGILVWRDRRASRARHDIAVHLQSLTVEIQNLTGDVHDKALGLDRRTDYVQNQLGLLEERQQIADLFQLLTYGELTGRLSREVAGRLAEAIITLRSERQVAQDEKAVAG